MFNNHLCRMLAKVEKALLFVLDMSFVTVINLRFCCMHAVEPIDRALQLYHNTKPEEENTQIIIKDPKKLKIDHSHPLGHGRFGKVWKGWFASCACSLCKSILHHSVDWRWKSLNCMHIEPVHVVFGVWNAYHQLFLTFICGRNLKLSHWFEFCWYHLTERLSQLNQARSHRASRNLHFEAVSTLPRMYAVLWCFRPIYWAHRCG